MPRDLGDGLRSDPDFRPQVKHFRPQVKDSHPKYMHMYDFDTLSHIFVLYILAYVTSE